jgi:hypothetical protein
MRIKTSELGGAALDWAVATAEGIVLRVDTRRSAWISYSSDWSMAGPIIEREGIDLTFTDDLHGTWVATQIHWFDTLKGRGPIEAAMRLYVSIKLGEEVDVPEELL